MKKYFRPLISAVVLAFGAHQASSLTFDGVTFPEGAISFADSVVSYTPSLVAGGDLPSGTYSDPAAALGVPDWKSGPETGSVSLGRGGILVLQFIDNLLTGSDDSKDDLWIFEIGTAVEDTFVDISTDGKNWLSLGKVTGSTSGIDIDFFGYGSSQSFSYVRLTDDPNENVHAGRFAGADIDAVGAISTVRAPDAVPDSMGTLFALGAVFSFLAFLRHRR